MAQTSSTTGELQGGFRTEKDEVTALAQIQVMQQEIHSLKQSNNARLLEAASNKEQIEKLILEISTLREQNSTLNDTILNMKSEYTALQRRNNEHLKKIKEVFIQIKGSFIQVKGSFVQLMESFNKMEDHMENMEKTFTST
ncbi:hypothetical protein I4U23_014659 [Adineta vaga]|nr:hypothetical protein I4U23_014659 [Adineta vaga]